MRGEAPQSAPAAEAAEAIPQRLGIWPLAWPAIVGNLLHATVGIVDVKIVGALGAPAVAAVTAGNRIFFLLQALLMGVTAGTTALVARAYGAGDRAEAERVTRASLWLCLGVSLAFSAIGVALAHPLAALFRLEEGTVELAATFIRFLSLFHAGFAVHFVLGTALRAAGDTRTPLVVGALVNAVNVGLVWALVHGRLGLPALGVAGAGLATGTAFTLGALVLGGLWLRGRLLLGRGPEGALARPRVRRLLHVGYPAALEQGVWQGGFLAFLWIVSLYGTAPYAAYGIGVNILAFSFVVGFGFSIAASTLVGQHLGAGDPEGAVRGAYRALGLSVAVMVVFGATIIALARPIAAFLIDDPEVVRLTVAFIYVLGSVQAFMAVEFAFGGALRGAGDTRFPLVAVLCGFFGARIALAALFAALGLSVEWIFAALVADYAVKAALLTARFRSGRWRGVLA